MSSSLRLAAIGSVLVAASALASPSLTTGLETGVRWSHVDPDDGINNAFTLPRSEFSLAMTDGQNLSARFVALGIRSAPETGYIGIDGERMVFALDVVEGRARWSEYGVSIAAGLLEHPWIRSGDDSWSLREIRRTVTSAGTLVLLERTDLAFEARWSTSGPAVTSWVQITSGEGARYRERNSGKNLVGGLELRVLSLWKRTASEWLVISAYGQEGSRGNQDAREHRYGVRIHGQNNWLKVGSEWTRAEGLAGDPIPEPLAHSIWLVLDPTPWAFAYGRFDAVQSDRDVSESEQRVFETGLGLRFPFNRSSGSNYAQLALGYTNEVFDSQARAIAGAAAQDQVNSIFMQVSVFMQGTLNIQVK